MSIIQYIFVFYICLIFTFIIQAQPLERSETKSDPYCGTSRATEDSLKQINDWFKSLSQDQRDKMNAHAASIAKTQFGSPNKDENPVLGSPSK